MEVLREVHFDIARELAVKKAFKSVILSSGGGEMAEKYKYKGVDHSHVSQIEKKGLCQFFFS